MGHSHAHAHDEAEGTFFLDQLFTILVSGALGIVAILMYQTGTLQRILVPMFYAPVLIGGSALILMAAIRAISVWQLAGARRMSEAQADYQDHGHGHSHSHGHEHAHSHGEDCGHDHGHSHGEDCGHDHAHAHDHAHSHAGGDDHGHEHGWAPWRYMVLAVPIFLYFLGFPRPGLSERLIDKNTSGALEPGKRDALAALVGGTPYTKAFRNQDQRPMALKFRELTEAAAIPSRQELYEGRVGILRGQYIPLPNSDREFTLLRVNMTCCVADQVFLEMRIVAPDPVRGSIAPQEWVRVTGLISFQKNQKGKWIPVITLENNDAIERNIEPTTDANIP